MITKSRMYANKLAKHINKKKSIETIRTVTNYKGGFIV